MALVRVAGVLASVRLPGLRPDRSPVTAPATRGTEELLLIAVVVLSSLLMSLYLVAALTVYGLLMEEDGFVSLVSLLRVFLLWWSFPLVTAKTWWEWKRATEDSNYKWSAGRSTSPDAF